MPRSIINSSGNRTINLDLFVDVNCPVSNNGYITINGLVSGTKGLTFFGTGTTDLKNSNNTYNGKIVLRSGTLRISGSSKILTRGGGSGNSYLINGILEHSSSEDFIFNNPIDGAQFLSAITLNPNAKIISNGPGKIHFRNPYADNSFHGTIEINSGGYVKVGNNDTIANAGKGAGTGTLYYAKAITISSGGTLEFDKNLSSNAINILANVSGSGSILVTRSSNTAASLGIGTIFEGINSHTGPFTIQSGTVTMNRQSSSQFTNNGTLVLNMSDSNYWQNTGNLLFSRTTSGATTVYTLSTNYVFATASGGYVNNIQIQSAGLGNDMTEFSGFVAGRIALVQRGVQPFQTKVNNAIAAGAVGVIIYNNTTGLTTPSLTANIPVIMVTQALGQQLISEMNAGTVTASLDTGVLVGASSTPSFNNSLSGTGILSKAGTGTIVVGPNANHSGSTNITAGVLRIDGSGRLPNSSVSVSSGAAFEILGGSTFSRGTSINGTGISSGGVIRSVSGDNTLSGNITQAAASRINSDANTLTLDSSGTLTGTFGLTFGGAGNINVSRPIATSTGTVTKDGTGTVVLSAANTYTGITTISGGTLRFATVSSLYNNATASWTKTNIIVNTGATFAINVGGTNEFTTTNVGTLLTNLLTTISNNGLRSGSSIGFDTTNSATDFTISNNITNSTGTGAGAVGLRKLGTGTLVLSGTGNTYTGGTIINGGTLKAGNATCFGTGTITLNAGATLDRAGFTITNTVVNNGGTIIN